MPAFPRCAGSPMAEPAVRTGEERILIIDDTPAIHEDIRAVLDRALDAGGDFTALEADLFGDEPTEPEAPPYRIDSAYQGQEGAALVEAAVEEGDPYALAFVDMRMPPGWDGLSTIPRLWEIDPDLEIVICTAYTQHDLDDAHRIAHAADQLLILKKPFDAVEVRQLARSLSVKRRMRAAILAQVGLLETKVEERTRELSEANAALQETLADRERLDVELRHAQKLEAVGQLASGIAHEINTPIQYLGDSLYFLTESFEDVARLVDAHRELAADSGPSAEERERRLADAEEEADYAYLREQIPSALEQAAAGVGQVAGIVGAMREFAHPHGKAKTHANLNHVIENALTVARHEYKYLADVETELAELPEIPLHVGDMGQVFLNLIVNAAHAIAEAWDGGASQARGRITVRTRLEPDAAHASVADTGVGIPTTILDRVFDPFFTTKEVGRGTGQGLAIARSCVVDKHGGSLTVESEEGKGTTFHVRVPLAADRAEA